MSIELQRAMFEDIKKEIDNIDRILNKDNDKILDSWLKEIYRAVCEY